MSYKKCLKLMAISAVCIALVGCGTNAGTLTNETGSNEIVQDSVSEDNNKSTDTVNEDDNETKKASIDLNNGDVIIQGSGAVFSDNSVIISEEGSYEITGAATDMMIVVDAGEKAKVKLTLNGVSITNSDQAAIFVKDGKKTTIKLEEGTTNTLSATGEIQAIEDVNVDGVIFAKSDLVIKGDGTLIVEASNNHAIVSKDDLTVKSGNLEISAKKHGLQGKEDVVIDGGNINITKCDEGIEGMTITINDGNISIEASDDGINASGESGDTMQADSTTWIVINGGNLYISAKGDGIDSNGDLTVNGGTIYVDGPEDGANGPLDFAGTGIINGGIVVAAGNSGMAQNFGTDSTSPSIYVNTSSMISGDITLSDSDGNVIFTYSPKKKYNGVVISHPDLAVGNTYTVTMGSETVEVELTSVIYGEANGFGNFGGFGGKGFGKRSEDSENFTPGDGQTPPSFDGNFTPGDGQTPPNFDGSFTPGEGQTPPNFGEKKEQ